MFDHRFHHHELEVPLGNTRGLEAAVVKLQLGVARAGARDAHRGNIVAANVRPTGIRQLGAQVPFAAADFQNFFAR